MDKLVFDQTFINDNTQLHDFSVNQVNMIK